MPCLELPLSDRFALIFALCLIGAAVLDIVLNDGAVVFFLLLKFADLVGYLAFWR